MLKRAAVYWACLVLLALTPVISQELETEEAVAKPSSDLLLPYFEVELAQGGATTFFAVVNALGKTANATVTLHTNWGIPVLTVPLKLSPGQVYTFDLADWLVRGDLPGGKDLSAGELVRLQAVLTGQRSPSDSLYYGTEIDSGRAAGFLALRTTGGGGGGKGNKSRPDALRGETFLVDPEQGPARGHDLLDIDRATSSQVCLRHNLRHLPGTSSGTEIATAQVVLWRDVAGQVLPAPVPADRRRKVDVSVFSKAGKLLRKHQLRLLPLEQVTFADLGLTEAQGRVELVTEDPSAVAALASEGGPVFEATCAQTAPSKEAAIRITTLVNGQDANSAPGPAIAIGSAVTWQYNVSNAGAFALSQIKVSDDQGIPVKCPRSSLNPGQAMTCTAKGQAEACQHRNIGTATGTAKKKGTVTAQDAAHYFGDEGARVQIVVSTNGQDANDPTGPSLQSGTVVNWTYQVSNTGTVRLFDIAVQDDRGVAVDCPRTSLAPGEPMTCLATGAAVPGQYRNVGKVTARAGCGNVADDDVSHYFGESESSLQIRALTNGFDANFPPGPSIPVDSPITWEYLVTNAGKLDLNTVSVTDSRNVAVSCPDTLLRAGQSMTCISRGVAASCQQSLQATVTARTSGGQSVSATDPSHYLGQAQSEVRIELAVNGSDADQPPGVPTVIGTAVQWTYSVTNTGRVALTGVQVTDAKASAVVCPQSELRPGESMTCTASGMAVSGDDRNVGTVTADPPCGPAVSASDPAHYNGTGNPGIKLRKSTNGQDANVPPGPAIAVGAAVSWDYVVTNTGQLPLSNVVVTDSRQVVVSCPQTGLQAGESMTCTGTGVAQACQYDNLGTATGITSAGQTATAVDPSYYFGGHAARVLLETATNGAEADAPPGPTILPGSRVTWTYTVTNAGNAPLSDIAVEDDQGVLVICPTTTLQPGEAMVCSASGIAEEGQYANVGTVTATPPCGDKVSAQDPSHYVGGGDGAIEIVKLTNGADVSEPPGPTIALGKPVAWTYRVANAGLVSLSSVAVSDNRGVAVTCPKTELKAGEAMICSATGTAQACQYDNVGMATGRTAAGQQVSATDQSFYLGGIQPGVTLELSVNGQEADVPAGPTITVGSPVTWIFSVINSGDAALANVRVRDDKGTAVLCPKTTLVPGELMNCYAFGTAAEGPFTSLGTVLADPPCGATVSAVDPSHYVGGGTPVLQIRKLTNNLDVARPPGPEVPVGDPVLWSYIVSNSGPVSISNVVVSDDRGVSLSCPKTVLQAGESMTCTGRGTAEACQYDNVGMAEARTATNQQLFAVDPSFYYGTFQASVQIETAINGNSADTTPGPRIEADTSVQWTYTVSNTSRAELANIKVVDDQGQVVTCPKATLNAGETMVCVAGGLAAEGQIRNLGTVTADPPCGSPVAAQDPAYYLGVLPASVDIQKFTNGHRAITAPGPSLPVPATVSWSYAVRNTGRAELSGIVVSDDRGVLVSCPKSTLTAGEAMTCTASGTTVAGQYRNVGTVTGETPYNTTVSDSDPSHYFGATPSIDVELLVQGQDADGPPGPTIQVGQTVNWSYVLTNNGAFALIDVHVMDTLRLFTSCPRPSLQPGESMTCIAVSSALCGQVTNSATALGRTSATSPDVSDSDPANYAGGEDAVIDIETYTNEQDAGSPPGPVLRYGDLVGWRYEVFNRGGVILDNIQVTDDQGVEVTCPYTLLPQGQVMTCRAWGTAVPGQYANVGKATGQSPVCGLTVSDTDLSHYKGPPVLGFSTTAAYEFIWYDDGSDADRDGSFWRPLPDAGFFFLGDYGQDNYGVPIQSVLTVRVESNDDGSSPGLASPVDYALIWNSSGSGADLDGSVWAPVPPAGYACTGHVFVRGYSKPNIFNSPGLGRYRCVRNDLVQPVALGELIWNDEGSGADDGVAAYRVPGVNVFFAIPYYASPAQQTFVPIGVP